MKKTTFLMVFLLLISSVLAQNALVDEFSKELQGQKISGPLGTLFGDEKINFHLETNEGTVIIGIITKNKVVESVEEKELEKPSLNVYTDEKTVLDIQRSENPLQSLKEALDDGRIKYEAVGFFNKIKFSVLSVFSNIAALFTSEDNVSEAGDEVIHKEDVIKEQPKEDVKEEEVVKEDTEKTGKEDDNSLLTGEVTAEVEPENEGHIVKLTEKGFEPSEITIKKGDKVTWRNMRSGKLNQGVIIGVRECRDVRSEVLEQGDSYSYTFEEISKCTIVDGIWTTKDSIVNVE